MRISGGRATSKIAQLPLVVCAGEDVLGLDVSMSNRWLLSVHMNKALHDMRGNHQHLALWQAFQALVRSLVDQVHQVAPYGN